MKSENLTTFNNSHLLKKNERKKEEETKVLRYEKRNVL